VVALTVAKRSRSPDSTRPSFPRPRRREASAPYRTRAAVAPADERAPGRPPLVVHRPEPLPHLEEWAATPAPPVPWGPVDRVLARLEPIRDFLRSHPVLVLAFVLVLPLVARPIAAFGVLLDQHPGFVG